MHIVYALIAAFGNALFTFGQKKSETSNNPFLFLLSYTVLCAVFLLFSALFFEKEGAREYIQRNLFQIFLSGVGLYITFLGFYFLFTRFGASYYILYAVFSILTTSIFVGIYLFGEKFNLYHLFSVVSAVLAILLFHLGQTTGK
ncbi:EamA family transporter [Leptospira wolffii]|uniref:EamA family transporter n=1 Tax=Leptospira wolffii TaxID=409998 RepID=A0ABV5BJG3_9LEPT|nr:EamA family transporter [Leptospira wolffii]TGK62352.1 transporter [Leptospira wolffii]TGK68131.1 transporter [Leptospira wolffii]TGK74264.1 transporter [Leptospira wolffii]TGL32161.1 transporter [Leptospira wolffii]TGL49165.1 transporter [Leptospira wolffii]